MSYEENNPPDIDITGVFNALKPIFSDLNLSEISFLYHGSYNVYTIKDKYIFRFPDKHFRNSKGKDMIINEVPLILKQDFFHKILVLIQNQL